MPFGTHATIERAADDAYLADGAGVASIVMSKALPTVRFGPTQLRLPQAFRALKSNDFRVIWASFIVGQSGFWISNVSLQLLVLNQTGGDSFQQGLLAFSSFIPSLFVPPFAGLLADRFDRRMVAVAAQVGLACMAGLLAIVASAGLSNLYVIDGFAFGLGVAFAMSAPVGSAIVANTVPPRDLPSAVALQSVALNLSRIIGPTTAVPIVLLGGPQAAFGLYATLSLVTAGLLVRLSLIREHANVERLDWWVELGQGFQHVVARPPAVTILSMVAVNGLLASSFGTLVPVFVADVLKLPGTAFFSVIIAMGVGAAIGALATGSALGSTQVTSLAVHMLALGSALFLIGLADDLRLVLLLSAVLGGLLYALMAKCATSLQLVIDDRNRGRVMGLYALCWFGTVPIGSLVLGTLAQVWGPSRAVLLFGSLTVGYAILIGLIHRARGANAIAGETDGLSN